MGIKYNWQLQKFKAEIFPKPFNQIKAKSSWITAFQQGERER